MFGDTTMNAKWACLAGALALALTPLTAEALGRNEKGCLVGGAAGGVGGKLLGDHPVLGAAAGCAVGTYVARDRALKERQAQKHKRQRSKVARNSREREERKRAERPAS